MESPREEIIRRSLRLKERIVSALSSQCRLSAGSNKEGMEQKALPFFSEDEAEDTEDDSFAQLPSGIPFIDDSCEMLDILDIEQNLVSTLGEVRSESEVDLSGGQGSISIIGSSLLSERLSQCDDRLTLHSRKTNNMEEVSTIHPIVNNCTKHD